MLNMIPMEIIQKYPNLKDAFIGGDILQAVKWDIYKIYKTLNYWFLRIFFYYIITIVWKDKGKRNDAILRAHWIIHKITDMKLLWSWVLTNKYIYSKQGTFFLL